MSNEFMYKYIRKEIFVYILWLSVLRIINILWPTYINCIFDPREKVKWKKVYLIWRVNSIFLYFEFHFLELVCMEYFSQTCCTANFKT